MKYFLTVGTQPHQFTRLLDYATKTINRNDLIMQIGHTKYQTDVKAFAFTPEFDKYIKECDAVITHGGVGSIINALLNNKKVIAVARQAKYDEHVDDHQFEIVDKLAKDNYILKANSIEEFEECIRVIKDHQFNNYTTNKSKFNAQIIKELNV